MADEAESGEPLRITARTWNDMVQTADAFRRGYVGDGGEGKPDLSILPCTTVLAYPRDACPLGHGASIKQYDGQTLDPGTSFTGPLWPDSLNHQRRPLIAAEYVPGPGLTPRPLFVPGRTFESIGIALEPVASDKIGRFAVGGYATCRLNVKSLDHLYARLAPAIPGEKYRALVTDFTGPAMIQWKEDAGELGEMDAIVLIGPDTNTLGVYSDPTSPFEAFPWTANWTYGSGAAGTFTLAKMTLPSFAHIGGWAIHAAVDLSITASDWNPADTSGAFRVWAALSDFTTATDGYTAINTWTTAPLGSVVTQGPQRGSAAFTHQLTTGSPSTFADPQAPRAVSLTIGYEGNVARTGHSGDPYTLAVTVNKWRWWAEKMAQFRYTPFVVNAAPTVTLYATYITGDKMPPYTSGKCYTVLAQDAEDGFDVAVALSLSDETVILSGELIYDGSGHWHVALVSGVVGTCTVTVTATDSAGQTGSWSVVVTVASDGGIVGGGDDGGGLP